MKKTLLIIFLMLPFLGGAQENLGFYLQDIKVIPADFDSNAQKFDDGKKESLHALRAYIEVKEDEMSEIEDKIDMVQRARSTNMIDTILGQQYLDIIDSVDEDKLVSNKAKQLLIEIGYMAQLYGDKKISEMEPVTVRIRKQVSEIKKDYEALDKLRISKKNLTDDINKAQLQIDKLYSKLYDEGKFKIWITSIFSFIVASLLLFFFVFITRKSETKLAKDFLSSGNGLQFITLFSLIIAIILFGVLGVLEGRELAAILSGISGYILGKGITRPGDGNKQQGDKQLSDKQPQNGGESKEEKKE